MKELQDVMKRRLGMMVPVWFPRDFDREKMRGLLRMTFWDAGHYLDWSNVVAVVDGAPWAEELLRELEAEFRAELGRAFEIFPLPENGGKGLALARGFETLLRRSGLTHFCIRDDDNDHSIYDLPHLVRTHIQIEEEERNEVVLVIGRRRDLRRPLGLWRAEFEDILSYSVWESAKFFLALRGQTLNAQWLAAYGWIPDLESGYKVYSRRAAELAVSAIHRAAEDYPDLQLTRFGVETVPNVEILASGGIIGETSRMAHEEQPLTTFTRGTTLPRLYGNQTIYVFRRLVIPPSVARQLVDNALPRSLLCRTGDGLQLAQEYRALVFEGIGLGREAASQPIRVAGYF
ncbi:MAG: hypothetical protein HYU36_04500 [Planctomycetes bacterium]|nr:hypothetical protein [Planctomycetota bacterium]